MEVMPTGGKTIFHKLSAIQECQCCHIRFSYAVRNWLSRWSPQSWNVIIFYWLASWCNCNYIVIQSWQYWQYCQSDLVHLWKNRMPINSNTWNFILGFLTAPLTRTSFPLRVVSRRWNPPMSWFPISGYDFHLKVFLVSAAAKFFQTVSESGIEYIELKTVDLIPMGNEYAMDRGTFHMFKENTEINTGK